MRDWNQGYNQVYLRAEVFVLILPMRDWNTAIALYMGVRYLRFDLTYEGLKLISIYVTFFTLFKVLILPMRDWNSKYFSRCSCSLKVLILPMRDWNIRDTPRAIYPDAFWSYLWGIEIGKSGRGKSVITLFWSYLWGIETVLQPWHEGMGSAFWSYLWGIETSNSLLI